MIYFAWIAALVLGISSQTSKRLDWLSKYTIYLAYALTVAIMNTTIKDAIVSFFKTDDSHVIILAIIFYASTSLPHECIKIPQIRILEEKLKYCKELIIDINQNLLDNIISDILKSVDIFGSKFFISIYVVERHLIFFKRLRRIITSKGTPQNASQWDGIIFPLGSSSTGRAYQKNDTDVLDFLNDHNPVTTTQISALPKNLQLWSQRNISYRMSFPLVSLQTGKTKFVFAITCLDRNVSLSTISSQPNFEKQIADLIKIIKKFQLDIETIDCYI